MGTSLCLSYSSYYENESIADLLNLKTAELCFLLSKVGFWYPPYHFYKRGPFQRLFSCPSGTMQERLQVLSSVWFGLVVGPKVTLVLKNLNKILGRKGKLFFVSGA